MNSGRRHPLMNVLDRFSNNNKMDTHGGRPPYNSGFPSQPPGDIYPGQTVGGRTAGGMGFNAMYPPQSAPYVQQGGRSAGGQTYNPYPSHSPQVYPPPQGASSRPMANVPNMYPPYGKTPTSKGWPSASSRAPGGYPRTGLNRQSMSADQILQNPYGRSSGARSPMMYPPRSPAFPNPSANPTQYGYPKSGFPPDQYGYSNNKSGAFSQYPMQMPVYSQQQAYPPEKKFDYNSGQTTDGTTDVTINLQSDGAKTDVGATSESNRGGPPAQKDAPAAPRLSRYSPFSMSTRDSGMEIVEKPIVPKEIVPLELEPDAIEPSPEPSFIFDEEVELQQYVMRPNDYMWLSCLVLWCWNCPLGFIAYCMSLSSSNAADQLDEANAAKFGKRALWISLTGIVVTFCIIVAMFTGSLSSVMKNGGQILGPKL